MIKQCQIQQAATDTRRPEVIRAKDELESAISALGEAGEELEKRLQVVLHSAGPCANQIKDCVPDNSLWSQIDLQTSRIQTIREAILSLLDRLEI